MAVGDAYVSWLSHTSSKTTFLSKVTDYFSHMLLQRWEAKIRRKEKSPQPGIELTTTRLWVRHAHHWTTLAGLCQGKKKDLNNIWQRSLEEQVKGRTNSRTNWFQDKHNHVTKVLMQFMCSYTHHTCTHQCCSIKLQIATSLSPYTVRNVWDKVPPTFLNFEKPRLDAALYGMQKLQQRRWWRRRKQQQNIDREHKDNNSDNDSDIL